MERKNIVYINGYVKSIEKYLITREAFCRMADAADENETMKLLAETGFGGENAAVSSAIDVEEIIAAEWKRFKDFLTEYAPSEKFAVAALAVNDFHNAEYAIRQKYLKLDDGAFVEDGYYPRELFIKAANGHTEELPKQFLSPVKDVCALFEKGEATGEKIDIIFLKAYYAFMLSTVKTPAWRNCVAAEIDLKNVSSALRYSDEKKAEKAYIDGGRLSKAVLKLIVKKADGKALEKTVQSPCFDLIKLGIEGRREGTLALFEREAESFSMKMMKTLRFETEGVIPMLVYVNYKLNEIKNVRIVVSLKAAGLDKETIKGRLRECYAG